MKLARPLPRWVAGLVTVVFASTIYGCQPSGNQVNASSGNPPSSNAPYGSVPPPQQQRTGMSTGKKVAILAGAAALLYLYNKHKNAQGHGPQGQYYRSRNGRVYYRDANGNAVWVTPPAGGIPVPADEAAQYERAAQQGNWDVNGRGSYPAPRGYAPAGPSGPPGPGGGY